MGSEMCIRDRNDLIQEAIEEESIPNELSTTEDSLNSSVSSILFEQNSNFAPINLMLTNARSLSPKIISLITFFSELKLHVAIITESWLADGDKLEENLVHLEQGTDIKVLFKNRPVRPTSRRSTAGGGVAILFDKNRCNFKERKIARNKFCLLYTSDAADE